MNDLFPFFLSCPTLTSVSAEEKTNPMVCLLILILSPKMEISTNLRIPFCKNEPNGM